MVGLQLPPMLDVSTFVAGRLVVVVVESVLGVYLLVESLVFLVPFLVHSQNISLGGGKSTCHVRLPHSCNKCALVFLLEAFAKAVLLAFSLCCGVGVLPLDLVQD